MVILWAKGHCALFYYRFCSFHIINYRQFIIEIVLRLDCDVITFKWSIQEHPILVITL